MFFIFTGMLCKPLAQPKAVYTETLNAEEVCRITVQEPEDFGTLYYHRAESYDAVASKKLVDSNITENTLVSGVAGYRYYVDQKATGTVSSSHTLIHNNEVDVARRF